MAKLRSNAASQSPARRITATNFEKLDQGTAVALYLDEIRSSCRPMSGSRPNHSASLTAAVVDAPVFLAGTG